MHPCAAYLEEAKGLLARERAALSSEDGEDLDELAERRSTALAMAWELRADYDASLLRRQLMEMREEQRLLEAEALAEHEKLRDGLHTVRKQIGYFSTDRREAAQAQKSRHFERIS